MTVNTSANRERAISSAERERQRFEHLVLGRPRPRQTVTKAAKKRKARKPVALAPGVEERVALYELHGGRQGTPETIAQLEHRQRRPGAIARLYASRAIDADQLAAADKIAETYRAVTADAPFRTASWETRTDSGNGGSGGDIEIALLGSVQGDWALEWWLRSIRQPEAMLAIIARDVGLTVAAERHGLGVARARKLVKAALTTWWNRFGRSGVVAS